MLDITINTIELANNLNQDDQQSCATFIINKWEAAVQELDGQAAPSNELDSIMKRHIREAMEMRQQAVATGLGENNPEWIKASLLEGMTISHTGQLGEDGEKIINLTINWLANFFPDREIHYAKFIDGYLKSLPWENNN